MKLTKRIILIELCINILFINIILYFALYSMKYTQFNIWVINKHKILSIRILIYIMPTLLKHHRKRLILSKAWHKFRKNYSICSTKKNDITNPAFLNA